MHIQVFTYTLMIWWFTLLHQHWIRLRVIFNLQFFWCSSAYTEQFKTCSKRMIFTKRKSAHSNSCSITTLQGLEIELVSKYKYLGVLIDDSLSFGPHIQNLVRKLKSKLGLFRVKQCLSFAARKRLIAATFLSVLDYCDIIYMQAPKHCLQALDSVYHGASLIQKPLLIIVYCTLQLDGRRCHPVDLSICTYLYIKSF